MSERVRPLLIFPDTNVLIQGRSLHDLPWKELDRDEIEVVICGPVIRELDRLKNRGGRAGRVARAMSTNVRDLMALPDKMDELCKACPRVVRRLALGSSVRTPVREGLDLTHDDQAIINQALAQLDAGDDVMFLTDDNFAAMMAEEFSLPVRLLSDHWRKPPEKDESEKEIGRRDAEIARLKAAEPAPALRFTDGDGVPFERLEVVMPRYLCIENAEISRLVERVASAAPIVDVRAMPTKPPAVPAPPTLTDEIARIVSYNMPVTPVTDAEIEKYGADYKTWLQRVRDKLAGLHVEWNRSREWPRAALLAANQGSRPAEGVLIEIEACGRFALSGYKTDSNAEKNKPADLGWLSLPGPPQPPRPRNAIEQLYEKYGQLAFPRDVPVPIPNPRAQLSGLRRDADTFYWREGRRDPARSIALGCETWRHGRKEDEFRFRFWGDDTDNIAGSVVGRASAANLTQAVEIRLPVRITFEDRPTLPIAEKMVADFERRLQVGRI